MRKSSRYNHTGYLSAGHLCIHSSELRGVMRLGIVTILLLFLGIQTASAQKQLVSTVDFNDALAYYRPRIALSDDGSYAVSWEAFRKLDESEEWQVAVQRFAANGNPVGSLQYLTHSAACDEQQVDDAVSERGLRNIDMSFASDGLLMMSMEQFEFLEETGARLANQTSRARLSLLDEAGQEYQPDTELDCA